MTTLRMLCCAGGVIAISLAASGQPAPTPPAPTPPTPATPSAAPAAPAAPAAEPSKKEEPKVEVNIDKVAAELLAKATDAAKNAKDLAANTQVTRGEGDDAGETLKGSFVVQFKSGPMPLGNWRFELDGKDGKRISAFDGGKMRSLDPVAKEMTEQDTGPMGMAFPMGEEGGLLPQWFLGQRMDFLSQMKPTILEQTLQGAVGGSKIGDEAVTVVKQVRRATLEGMDEGEAGKAPVLTESVTLHLAADNLPRKVEMLLEITGDEGMKQRIVQTFSGVKVNATPGAEVFALTAPEGFKTRQVKAEESEGSPALKVKEGDAALDFALKDADGKEYTLASFKGKVVLLDFWATWCGPCVAAMPSIQKLHEHFAGKPVAVIGVNTWERKANAGPEFVKKKGYTYLNLLKGDDLAKAYGISGIPTLIVIDPQGKVAHTAVGFGPGEEEHLMKLITEKLPK